MEKIYPNSPLVEVVFEIRFSGEPSIECHRDLFYNDVKNEYSNILVPKATPQEFPALQPYRFERKDKSSGVMLAINRFAYYSKEYPGYKKFKKEAMRLIKKFGDIYNLSKLNRTGWRYINVIPFTREKGIIPLKDFLNFELNAPKSIMGEFENISMTFISKVSEGSITANIKLLSKEEQEAILLDLDYAKKENLVLKEVESYMEESHRYNRELFEEFITDSYRKYLKGETI